MSRYVKKGVLYYDDQNGFARQMKVKLESTIFSNISLLIDATNDNPIGVWQDDCIYIRGDRVKVTADIMGYIAPGVNRPGEGQIVKIVRDNTDHWFAVLMDNGEFGFMKSARFKLISA